MGHKRRTFDNVLSIPELGPFTQMPRIARLVAESAPQQLPCACLELSSVVWSPCYKLDVNKKCPKRFSFH